MKKRNYNKDLNLTHEEFKNLRILNFVSQERIDKTPAQIETLIKKEYLDEWQKNDPDPYYKIQMMEYPIRGNELIYTENFFKSFLSKLKERPIPGSKNGHSMLWGERPDTDFIMVGGMIESNGDGTGKVYFKNYIPPEGEKGSNKNFITENKSNMVHYSLVTYPGYEVTIDDEGNEIYNAVESIKGERNDAVEYGLGAMKQITNQEYNTQNIIRSSVSNARKLIKAGTYDNSSSWSFPTADSNKLLGPDGNDWANYKKWHFIEDTGESEETKARYKYPFGKNDKVYRSALRAIASRAGQQGLSALSGIASELIELIDKQEEGEENLTKEEILKRLNSLKAEAVTISEVAEAMGQADQIITDEHVKALKVYNKLKELKIDDPIEYIKDLEQKRQEDCESVRNAALDKVFGSESGDNMLRRYAGKQTEGLYDDSLKNKIEEVKKDPIALKLARDMADENSELNHLDFVGRAENKNDTGMVGNKDGVKVVTL